MTDPRKPPLDDDEAVDGDTKTDDIDLPGLSKTRLTHIAPVAPVGESVSLAVGVEADVILISHPESRHLGRRFRLAAGEEMVIGRSDDVTISLPEVGSLSRRHARLLHEGGSVLLEDLESTNGTYFNGQALRQPVHLRSGDRFQAGTVHFKFLHDLDPEHAYYEAIYDLVTRDGLTEIFNRRKYEEEIEREISRARRHLRPLALVLFDLDEFKEINDACGHLCGDFLLKRIAALISSRLRPEQTFARIGGDEFAILCPEMSAENAEGMAERLRGLVAELGYRFAGVPVPVTCSFGVAAFEARMETPEDLFAAADRALYRSKEAGGSRVTVAD